MLGECRESLFMLNIISSSRLHLNHLLYVLCCLHSSTGPHENFKEFGSWSTVKLCWLVGLKTSLRGLHPPSGVWSFASIANSSLTHSRNTHAQSKYIAKKSGSLEIETKPHNIFFISTVKWTSTCRAGHYRKTIPWTNCHRFDLMTVEGEPNQ